MVLDFGDGVKTDAQLTIPAVGNGTFPPVILITGSGAEDMNETAGYIRIDNATGGKDISTYSIFSNSRIFIR